MTDTEICHGHNEYSYFHYTRLQETHESKADNALGHQMNYLPAKQHNTSASLSSGSITDGNPVTNYFINVICLYPGSRLSVVRRILGGWNNKLNVKDYSNDQRFNVSLVVKLSCRRIALKCSRGTDSLWHRGSHSSLDVAEIRQPRYSI